MRSLWKWRNWIWYFVTGYLFISGIFDIIILTDIWGVVEGVIYMLIGGSAFLFLTRSQRRYKHSGTEPTRMELLTLLTQRTVDKESMWLNRNMHIVFYAYKTGRVFSGFGVARADEDQARVLEATGRTANDQ